MSNRKVAVVGAGVEGLSSALCVATQNRNLDVTIISDQDLKPTSIGPPGIFRPSEANELSKKWAQDSYDHFLKLANSAEASSTGCQLVSGFVLNDNLSWLQSQEAEYGDIVANFRWLRDSDMHIFNVPFKHGYFYTTLVNQTHFYVPWLEQKARLAGCRLINQKLGNLLELADKYDVVINCSGLGARRLVPDETVYPVRGIAIRVAAPWIKQFVICDDGMTYIIPGMDSVFLGTVRQKNNWKTTVDFAERQAIIKRCTEIMPSLQNAPVIDDFSGLRPYRSSPRVEIDHLETRKGSLPVIHNYGHGGHGVTLSWGCALYVNQLLTEVFRKKSHL